MRFFAIGLTEFVIRDVSGPDLNALFDGSSTRELLGRPRA
jgi:hypothetical protein